MKIIYVIIFDSSKSHYCYLSENLKLWIIPSIKQCHKLNPDCEINIITNIDFKNDLPFVNFYELDDYVDDDIKWFDTNYVHLSTNQYQFEKNAILRFLYIKSFCVKHNINNFLHLEPDVLVFSNVIEDSVFFENYDVTLIHHIGAGVCFFNNSINVLLEYFQYIKNSYSIPQLSPKAFDLNSEKNFYEYNITNKIGAGGVSDMHFWNLYNSLHKNDVFEEMDINLNDIFYHTFLVDQTKEQIWLKEDGLKSLFIENDMCFGVYDNKKVRIKYLHCHGNNKLLIPKLIKNI